MLNSKIKTATELLLKRIPEKPLQWIAFVFSWFKKILAKDWKQHQRFPKLIRFCDFVITRCNGDRFIEFELSNICNAQCVFCPYPDLLRTDKKFMHMDEAILEQNMAKLSHFKQALISFTPTTGDTLLHPAWDTSILRIIADKHIARATMFTNAIRLDGDNRRRFGNLLNSRNGHKLSELYFSVGGLDASVYKALYKVDRFDAVTGNISEFLHLLKNSGLSTGVHIHVKMPAGMQADPAKAEKIFNGAGYPFVYYSFSALYYSNDRYTRNALIDYRSDVMPDKAKACAYLQKTRFAADGSIWADGCVISEMPGDSALKLGEHTDSWPKLEAARSKLMRSWEQDGDIPAPCQGCTMYRSR